MREAGKGWPQIVSLVASLGPAGRGARLCDGMYEACVAWESWSARRSGGREEGVGCGAFEGGDVVEGGG
jgi:hypothetical protein